MSEIPTNRVYGFLNRGSWAWGQGTEEVGGEKHVDLDIHMYVYTHIHIYICISIYRYT